MKLKKCPACKVKLDPAHMYKRLRHKYSTRLYCGYCHKWLNRPYGIFYNTIKKEMVKK